MKFDYVLIFLISYIIISTDAGGRKRDLFSKNNALINNFGLSDRNPLTLTNSDNKMYAAYGYNTYPFRILPQGSVNYNVVPKTPAKVLCPDKIKTYPFSSVRVFGKKYYYPISYEKNFQSNGYGTINGRRQNKINGIKFISPSKKICSKLNKNKTLATLSYNNNPASVEIFKENVKVESTAVQELDPNSGLDIYSGITKEVQQLGLNSTLESRNCTDKIKEKNNTLDLTIEEEFQYHETPSIKIPYEIEPLKEIITETIALINSTDIEQIELATTTVIIASKSDEDIEQSESPATTEIITSISANDIDQTKLTTSTEMIASINDKDFDQNKLTATTETIAPISDNKNTQSAITIEALTHKDVEQYESSTTTINTSTIRTPDVLEKHKQNEQHINTFLGNILKEMVLFLKPVHKRNKYSKHYYNQPTNVPTFRIHNKKIFSSGKSKPPQLSKLENEVKVKMSNSIKTFNKTENVRRDNGDSKTNDKKAYVKERTNITNEAVGVELVKNQDTPFIDSTIVLLDESFHNGQNETQDQTQFPENNKRVSEGDNFRGDNPDFLL